MGVYIKGLKMPKTGRVVISIDAKGKIYSETPGLAFWKYAAVEIPTPHGRLIDRDAVPEVSADPFEEAGFQGVLDDMPIFLEAEGKS